MGADSSDYATLQTMRDRRPSRTQPLKWFAMHEGAAAAVAHVRAYAEARRTNDLQRLEAALARRLTEATCADLVDALRASARLTLNFHPDRILADGTSVATGLLRTGEYRPQGLTGLSSGGRTAVPGGDRTRWEHEFFGGAYTDPTVRRPVYGALDLTKDPFGGSPRFGSSFLVLRPHCFERATFFVGDSHVAPTDRGTIDSAIGILAGLFDAAKSEGALGHRLDVDALLSLLAQGPTASPPARDLDNYIETHIHDTVSLATDVESIVIDPSFRGTDTERHLLAAAATHEVALDWHDGSLLDVVDVPADYRGPTMPQLASAIVGPQGTLDAAAIGRSASTIAFSPPSIAGDPPDSPLQQHKYLWHCLLRFGHSAERRAM